ncbi:MAG TPA: GNAT family N-acetyltransferase, partial [Lacipirellulaceae bacterium]|nr:GNAT family N-acetyltransferase [Lacipirellulaceae bacterium]
MIDVVEFNRLSDLVALRDDWQRLLRQTAGYSFFHTLEWLQASWETYRGAQRLRILAVRRDGQIVGIVPWCVRTEQRRIGPVRVLTYPLDDWGAFLGPLGPDPRGTIRAAIRHVCDAPRDWDMIDLRWVDEAADEFLAIGEAFREAAFEYRVFPRNLVRLCRTSGGWDQYEASRSRNWRRRMKHDLNTLEKVGPVRLQRYRPAAGAGSRDEHDGAFDLCAQLAARSWQADDPSQSTLCSPRVAGMLRDANRAAAALGMLDANILYVGDRPVAYNYNYVAEGRIYGLRCGYDATAGLESCGRVLLYLMIKDSFERGDQEYNFGPGRQEYKERFGTEMRYAYTFRHHARFSLRSQLLHLKQEVEERVLPSDLLTERRMI